MRDTLVFPNAEPKNIMTLSNWAKRAASLRGIQPATAKKQILNAIRTGHELYNTKWSRIGPHARRAYAKKTKQLSSVIVRPNKSQNDYLLSTCPSPSRFRSHASNVYTAALEYVIANRVTLTI